MKVGKTGLKMSDGTIRHFASEEKRDNFEHVAEAYKHGWNPKAEGGNVEKLLKSHLLKERRIPMLDMGGTIMDPTLQNIIPTAPPPTDDQLHKRPGVKQYADGTGDAGDSPDDEDALPILGTPSQNPNSPTGISSGPTLPQPKSTPTGSPQTPNDLLNNYLLGSYSPPATAAKLNDLNTRANSGGELIAKSVAGIGDAISAAGGQKGNALPTALEREEARRNLIQQQGLAGLQTAAQAQQAAALNSLSINDRNAARLSGGADRILKDPMVVANNKASDELLAIQRMAEPNKTLALRTWMGSYAGGAGLNLNSTDMMNRALNQLNNVMYPSALKNGQALVQGFRPEEKDQVISASVHKPPSTTVQPGAANIPVFTSPDQVPDNVKRFKTPDGRTLLNPNYKGR